MVPTFLYNVLWNRINYESKSIFTPMYVAYDGKSIASSKKWPEDSAYLNAKFVAVQKITGSPFPAPSKTPFFIEFPEEGILQIGGLKENENKYFTRIKRTKYGSAKYISLRDIVNPNFSESEVIEQIEKLYFDKKSKNYLYRLVKILYSGKPEEEYKIISNLFSYEKDFAKFLSSSMFSAEIIPLVHGPFLQSFISNFDERLIKFAYPKLSLPVRQVLESSVSKNKLKMIKSSPAAEPKPGEGLLETLETEVYKRFSRNIYFEEGEVITYKEEYSNFQKDMVLKLEDTRKINFWKTNPGIFFYGMTKTKLLFQTSDWLETLRFDWFISKKEWEPYEFHRLPPDLILEIPYFPTGICVVGGGITAERKAFEFVLQWFEY
jgi:hypothetical protein